MKRSLLAAALFVSSAAGSMTSLGAQTLPPPPPPPPGPAPQYRGCATDDPTACWTYTLRWMQGWSRLNTGLNEWNWNVDLSVYPSWSGSVREFSSDTWWYGTWREDWSISGSTPDGLCQFGAGTLRAGDFVGLPQCARDRLSEMVYQRTFTRRPPVADGQRTNAWYAGQGSTNATLVLTYVTPEPATLALVATGLGAIGAGARRRRKRLADNAST